MSLNAPNLDDRKFQDIVDDVKRQIGLRCPEWTDHNVSDPGVTLLELFAWMMEMMLFRLNQVPERNYLKFLEMLDITLEPPKPARAELLYRLHQPISDAPDAVTQHKIEAGLEELRNSTRSGMVAATRRTDTEAAIEFTTEADIEWKRPTMQYMLAVSGRDPAARDAIPMRIFPARVPHDAPENSPLRRFYMFREPEREDDGSVRKGNHHSPLTDDTLYIGFKENMQRHVLRIEAQGVTSAGIGVDPNNPLQRWEAYTGESVNPWRPVKILHDHTNGFDKTGSLEMALPAKMLAVAVEGENAYWVRCRYIGKDAYSLSPAFTNLTVFVAGAQVPAANYKILAEETLGLSDGTPGQSFRLLYPPALPLDEERGEVIRVGDAIWKRCFHFAESGPEDRHFMCDCIAGEVQFGPSVLQPNGTTRQHGAIPPKGQKIVLAAYRHGGGTQGNVRELQICVDKDNHSFIADVTNLDVATGGHDIEDIERAKMRARAMLQMRHRAVTAEDFEFLARQSSPQVGRAHCLRTTDHPALLKAMELASQEIMALKKGEYTENTELYRLNQQEIGRLQDRLVELQAAREDDMVSVLIVPSFGANILTPSLNVVQPENFPQLTREVEAYLNTKRLLTTKVQAIAPDYVEVSITIRVASDPSRNASQVAYRVKDSLNRLVHPLYGGENGTGWPFGRALTSADVYARVGAVEGVAFLTPPVITRHDNREDALPVGESAPDAEEEAASSGTEEVYVPVSAEDANTKTLLPHQLWLTRFHTVEVIPVPFFNMLPNNPHMVRV